ncbi:MAG: hypothetical protein ACYCSW_05315 [bacterium]
MENFEKKIDEIQKLAKNYQENYKKKAQDLHLKLSKIKDILKLIPDSKYFPYYNRKSSGGFLSWDGNDFFIEFPKSETKETKKYEINLILDIPYNIFNSTDRLIEDFMENINDLIKS